jgi:hypothetical protein
MDTERTAAEALGLLSDTRRIDILRTVARAQNEDGQRMTADLSFSEIYDRVGSRTGTLTGPLRPRRVHARGVFPVRRA